MKKGFSLIEMIISVGLISIIFVASFGVIKNINTSSADPYEDIRNVIADATNSYLNMNVGSDDKNHLYSSKVITLNTNILINEGLLTSEYYVENTNNKLNVENKVITVYLDDEGFLNYSINME